MNPDEAAAIRVQRASEFFGAALRFKVLVDGREVAKVGNGDTVSLSVAPGIHTFSVVADRYLSEPVTLEVRPGDTATLLCGFSPGTGRRFLAAFTSPANFVYLRSANDDLAAHATTQGPPPTANVRVMVSLLDALERIPATTEEVRVPPGVTVKVKRSRTFEHTVEIDWNIAGAASLDVGLKQVLGGSIRGEISRTQRSGDKESETVEYEVELKGDTSTRYQLIWTDIWRSGTAELQKGRGTEVLPFRYREKTELEVVAVI